MSRAILIQDPHHDYAARFIDQIHRKYGYRAVCFFTDRKRRAYERGAYPILESDAVEAHYEVQGSDLGAFAERVASAHDIAGVIPYNEECVLPAAELSDALGLGWNALDVIRRFRDKFAMKEHLRRVDPGMRMNASWRVKSVDDVFASGEAPFARYVVKPNSGFGNRQVGFFDVTSTRAEIAQFIASARGAPLVLEEYIGGTEFFVNGQTDAHGACEVVAIFEYVRIAANGRANLDYRTRLVRRDEPVFDVLAAYATRVVRGTGLVRSPFHLEVKLDDDGPCLVEVGARLAGNRNALVCNAVHGDSLDVFDVAAHYYLSDRDYGPLTLNWDVYDGLDVRYVNGIARAANVAKHVDEILAVESLPSFQSWAKKPVVGDRIARTTDCLSMPWSVVLSAPAGANLDADEELVRSLLGRVPQFSPRVALERARRSAQRVAKAVRWQAERIRAVTEGPLPMKPPGLIASILDRPRALLSPRRIVRKLQEANIGRRYTGRLELASPEREPVAADMITWAKEYLAQPHPELGRKGAVCPFITKTLAAGRFLVTVHPEVTRSEAQIRDIVLSHADEFLRRYPKSTGDTSTSLLIVLPNLLPAAHGLVDAIHADTKTHLMKQKLMVAALHPRSTHPAIWNPAFPVLRAPLPCFAIRHMVVHDIVFVGHNLSAFQRYDREFGALFAQGKVPNEFGYVDLYAAARSRFGLA
jgi:heptaprenyl diphosphate synthase